LGWWPRGAGTAPGPHQPQRRRSGQHPTSICLTTAQ